jgi:PAS domain S-box-containing protein
LQSSAPQQNFAVASAGALGSVAFNPAAGPSAADVTAHLRAVVDAAVDVALLAVDPDGVVTLFNRGAEKLLGYAAAEAVGRLAADVFHDPRELRQRADELAAACRPSAGGSGAGDDGFAAAVGFAAVAAVAVRDGAERRAWTYVRKDGSRLTVDLTVTCQREPAGGRVTGFVVTATDVTGYRAMARAVAEGRERYRSVIDALAEGVVIQGADGRVLECNPAAEQILGVTADEMLGRASVEARWRAVRADGSAFAEQDHPALLTLRTGEPQRDVLMGLRRPAAGGAGSGDATGPGGDAGRLAWIRLNTEPVWAVGVAGPAGVISSFADVTARLEAERRLAEERARLAAFVDHAPAAIAMFDTDMRYVAVSRRWVADYKLDGQPLIGRTHYDVMPDLPAAWRANDRRCLAGEVARVDDAAWRPAGWDHDQHLRWEGRPWYAADGAVAGVMMFSEDITAAKRLEAEAAAAAERLDLALAAGELGSWDWDVPTGIIACDQRLADQLGRAAADMSVAADAWSALLHPDDEPGVRQAVRDGLPEAAGAFSAEMRVRHADGSWRWILSRGKVVSRGPDGAPLRVVGTHADVTARRRMEEELRRAAITDRLTGLPNRALLLDRLGQAVLRAQRVRGYRFGLLFLDFDRFKIINDSLGHDVGDELLREISRRLRAALRPGDTVTPVPAAADGGPVAAAAEAVRLGGDEFVVLLDGLAAPADATLVADRLLRVLAAPYRLGPHEVYSSASIGVVTSDVSGESADAVLRDADTAMYEAKLAGKARYTVFDVSMRQRVADRMTVENDLRRAVDAGDQLCLEYQPIVSLETGQVDSVEALLRWRHPTRGLVPPGQFVSVAEDTGLIVPIGDWVLREACRQLAAWRRDLGPAAPRGISVNLSRTQLALADFPGTLAAVLAEHGLDPASLQLEVTEGTVMRDAHGAARTLRAIKATGVRLAMDDFGTGHSSLACLHEFPFDVLKIDRSFVANLGRGRAFASLVQAITLLARNLGIKVVAEGVETADQVTLLQTLDCEFAQGYHFGRPMPAAEAGAFRVRQAGLAGAA